MEYHQPAFYRFSQDSIFLVKNLVSHIRLLGPGAPLKALDLCAGSGVVGIETMTYRTQRPVHFDFCEVQGEFHPYLTRNLETFFANFYSYGPQLYMQGFSQLKDPVFREQYDLIACNPPYFEVGKNRTSPTNEKRNKCRFYIEGSRAGLFITILHCLKIGGRAYVLQRNDFDPLNQFFPRCWDYRHMGDPDEFMDLREYTRDKRISIYEIVKKGRLPSTAVKDVPL